MRYSQASPKRESKTEVGNESLLPTIGLYFMNKAVAVGIREAKGNGVLKKQTEEIKFLQGMA
jgi:hypothetical protein